MLSCIFLFMSFISSRKPFAIICSNTNCLSFIIYINFFFWGSNEMYVKMAYYISISYYTCISIPSPLIILINVSRFNFRLTHLLSIIHCYLTYPNILHFSNYIFNSKIQFISLLFLVTCNLIYYDQSVSLIFISLNIYYYFITENHCI